MIASFSIYPYTIVNGHTCRQQPSDFSHSQGDGSSRSESDERVHSKFPLLRFTAAQYILYALGLSDLRTACV
eukprot:scaffold16944_cov60-Phaeocystis_antarctica.AAC.4